MAEIYTGESLPTDSTPAKFTGVRVNTGAAGEFLAIAGDTVVTEQAKRVASMRVNVSSAAGFGQVAGLTTDAAVEGDGATGTLLARIRGIAKNIGSGSDGVGPADGSGTIVSMLRALVVNSYTVLTRSKISAAVITTVAASATTGTLKAVNTNRLGLIVNNDADKTMRMKYGTTASLTSYTVKIPAGGYWEMPQPIYTGVVDALWDAAPTGSAIITEI